MSKGINLGNPNQGGPQQQGPQARINIDDLQDITCDECGNDVFKEVHFIKKASKITSPDGQERMFPIPAFACVECGHVNDEFINFKR